MSQELKNPYLVVYAFFEEIEFANDWGKQIADKLGVPLYYGNEVKNHLTLESRVDIYTESDSPVVYILLYNNGPCDLSAWKDLHQKVLNGRWQIESFGKFSLPGEFREFFEKIIQEPSEKEFYVDFYKKLQEKFPPDVSNEIIKKFERYIDSFQGITVFFGAEVSNIEEQWLEQIPLPSAKRPPAIPSPQKWGSVWQLFWRSKKYPHNPQVYAVLSTTGQINQPVIFSARSTGPNPGVDELELALHKGYHYLTLYNKLEPVKREEKTDELTQKLNEHLLYLQSNNRPVKPQDVVILSNQYTDFVKWISTVKQLKTNVEIHKENFQKNISQLKYSGKSDQIFKTHLQRLEQGILQLVRDLEHYEAIRERLEIQLQTMGTVSGLIMDLQERLWDRILTAVGIFLAIAQVWSFFKKDVTAQDVSLLVILFVICVTIAIGPTKIAEKLSRR